MRFSRAWRLAVPLAWLLAAHAGAAADPAANKAREGLVTRSDVEIVDCLLPGQVRQLGSMTYVTARRPVRTTTADCRLRGGEYVAYDRADLKSALRVWMQAAEAGDAEAQTRVGQIYERGLGGEPNYAAALVWYQKAAKQGYSQALFELGTFYEQGLGVEKDPIQALNLYRQAWGLPENSIVYEDAARRQEDALRAELTKTIDEKNAQITTLEKQLERLEQDLRQRPKPAAGATNAASGEAATEIATLRSLVQQLEAERSAQQSRLAAVPATRQPLALERSAPLDPKAELRAVQGVTLGRYYALVIGNQKYQKIESLQTPHNDVERAAKVLKDKYGFSVQVLEDANDVDMLQALNDLNKVLRPEDNLLIYYAGHGLTLASGPTETGYWLPVNADPKPNDTFWVPNEQITAHVGRLPAKRVLVVADSCYAGLLSTDPSINLFGADGPLTLDYLKYKLPKRARLLLASGGDQPVLDAGGGGNSVFARAFVDALEANTGVMSAPALFLKVRDRVKVLAAQSSFVQVPELKSIKGAGHEVGDFFFVPKS